MVQMMKEKFRKVKRQIGDKKKKDKSKIQYVIENMIGADIVWTQKQNENKTIQNLLAFFAPLAKAPQASVQS